jgi:hypothetical protein
VSSKEIALRRPALDTGADQKPSLGRLVHTNTGAHSPNACVWARLVLEEAQLT